MPQPVAYRVALRLWHACPCPQDSPYRWRLDKWADDLSCAVFSLANVVTIMYYIVDTSTHVRLDAPFCAPDCLQLWTVTAERDSRSTGQCVAAETV